MHFFTLNWYREAEDEADFIPVFERYSRHLEAMRGVLPPEVLELAALPGVDDGLIVEVHHLRSQETLLLILRCGDLQMGYFDLLLTYEGASITPQDQWTLARLARDTWSDGRYPDLAYHEVDLGPDGGIAHRLLFHPGRWFEVRCRRLRWERVPRPDRTLPVLADRFPGGPSRPPRALTGRIRPEPRRG